MEGYSAEEVAIKMAVGNCRHDNQKFTLMRKYPVGHPLAGCLANWLVRYGWRLPGNWVRAFSLTQGVGRIRNRRGYRWTWQYAGFKDSVSWKKWKKEQYRAKRLAEREEAKNKYKSMTPYQKLMWRYGRFDYITGKII